MILTRSTRLSQPQGPVELDYTNPLVRGVVVAWVPSSSKNLVGGRPASVGGVVKPGEIGLVRATTGTQKAFTAPDSLDQRTENFTSFSILRRVGELPINFDGFGKNWQSNTGPTYVSDTVAYNANSEGQNSIRAVFGRSEGLTPTDVYSGQETTEWHSIASTHDGSTGSLYVSGVLRASVAVQPVVYGASGDNSFGANTSGKSGSMEYALVLRWNRALSAGEIASIEANPWQLFRPVQRRVYFDMGAGGGESVTHDTSGAITSSPAELSGAAGRTRQHDTSAELAGAGSVVSATARRNVTLGSSGALSVGLAVVTASASHTAGHAEHSTSGTVAAPGASLSGSASRVPAPVTHDASGDLGGMGAVIDGQAQGPQTGSMRPGFEMSSRKVYIKRGKRIHIFDSVEDADAWMEAEQQALQEIRKAKPTKRKKAKVFKGLDEAVPHDVVRLDVVRSMVDYLGIPVEMPTLEARQDWAEVARVALMARQMQDEEDIELLLAA